MPWFKIKYVAAAGLAKFIPKSMQLSLDSISSYDTRTVAINSGDLSIDEAESLKKVCHEAYKARESGASVQYSDAVKICKMLKAERENTAIDCVRNHVVAQMKDLVEKIPRAALSTSPGRGWLYTVEYGQVCAWVISEVTYRPPQRRQTEHVVVELIARYPSMSRTSSRCFTVTSTKTVGAAVVNAKFMFETPELYEAYQEAETVARVMAGEVGQTYKAKHGATADTDYSDSSSKSRRRDYYYSRGGTVKLYTGHGDKLSAHTLVTDNISEDKEVYESNLDRVYSCPVAIPAALTTRLFDFNLDTFITTHVLNLVKVLPDPTLWERLVVPADSVEMINMLTKSEDVQFRDIIAGKTGGVIVMLSGPPGLGKTLTAEVVAAAQGRALYSVQCSQLGTNPDDLESNLNTIMERAVRWNAVLLLDEVDVYVHERGDDVIQNAMVGVFLRTLEYYPGLMFMTTNMPENIDDAVISRCIAHIKYSVATGDALRHLWTVLSRQFEVNYSVADIDRLVKVFGPVPGRSIKSLMKLVRLRALSKERAPTVDDAVFLASYIGLPVLK